MMASSQDHHPNRDHQRTSSAEDTTNNNNSNSSSSSNNNHGDNNHDRDRENGQHQSPPQQAMGYPPVMGYPPPGQYPHPSPYNAYPGAQGYYNPHQPPFLSQQRPPQPVSMSRFASGILAVVIFFVILSCMISLGAYMILHPVNPEFRITGLSVTNFGVAPGVSITGSFEANVTVSNPNEKLRVSFHRIESYVYYKNPGAELAWTTAAPFLMETNTTHVMTVRASADGDVGGDDAGDDGETRGHEEAAVQMEKDWRNGTVEMGLEMGMWATFRSEGGWWSSRVVMRVQCDGLPVGFAGGNGTTKGTGVWTGNGLPKGCNTYR